MKINRRKSIIIAKLLVNVLCIILILILLERTFAKYKTEVTSQTEIQAAFYLLNDEYQSTNIKLDSLEPRDNEYVYTFSISNNKSNARTETSLEYELNIITTTNLPLSYKLYKNEDYKTGTNIITSDDILPDEHGTYFRTIKTEKEVFTHTKNETNIYTLVIKFPKQYNKVEYQDIIELITIEINSNQLIWWRKDKKWRTQEQKINLKLYILY